ncbi:MAG: hypothetical protein M3R08_04980 [Bacteroidota bacterium]|nr:hypothetical protein [Bacteroidota bacterium]
MKHDTDYFGSDQQQFMLNLRVQHLDGLMKKLEVDGVRLDPKRQDEKYGRFAWVYDPDGNKIELWNRSRSTSAISSPSTFHLPDHPPGI